MPPERHSLFHRLLIHDHAFDAGAVFSSDVHHVDAVAELSHVDDGFVAFGSLVIDHLTEGVDDADAYHVVGIDTDVAVSRVRIDRAGDHAFSNTQRSG